MIILKALLLGIVEGVTEFLPISSTGHLILVSHFVDYPERMRDTFEIFIQLGAIVAVMWHFREQLSRLVRDMAHDPAARALIGKVLVAFCPAAALGFLFGHSIQAHLFKPTVVGMTLLVGGMLIILIERVAWPADATDLDAVSWREAISIGCAQVLSLIPGVSRAAATIIGGLVVGLSRPTATIFSFYLSIPTLMAASLYSLLKARHLLALGDLPPLAFGFVAAFVSALLVVRGFLSYVQRHDFTPFGVYRVALGLLVLALIH